MQVIPLEGNIGAELRGVDLRKPLGDADVRLFRKAFADHLLVMVRGQELAGEDHDRFVKLLGQLQRFDHGQYFEFMTNMQTENASAAGQGRLLFHNDGAYRANPRAGTSLFALIVSPTSPPTSFASGVRAYKLLDDETRQRIEELHALHTLDYDDPYQESNRVRVADFPPGRKLEDVKHAVHPIVVRIAHSGRKAVFVSEFYTSHIVEYGPHSVEGEELLQKIFAVLYQPSNIYSHRYRNGDLLVWDNFGLQHARSGAVDYNPRHLRRLVVKSIEW